MKAFSIRLPDHLHEALRNWSFESRISMNKILVLLIQRAVEKREEE